MPKHAHYDTIIAYANGEKIQVRSGSRHPWKDIDCPSFAVCLEYRVKPPKRTPYQVYMDTSLPKYAPYSHVETSTSKAAWLAVLAAAKAGEFDEWQSE
jgi:hypothetical protein